MNHSTATVDTLTASVRVLQVGNRQITLSVAKQLDRAERHQMTPMGRIRVGDGQFLIGAAIPGGELVTSRFHDPGEHPYLFAEDGVTISACARHCGSSPLFNPSAYRSPLLEHKGITFQVGSNVATYRNTGGHDDHSWWPEDVDTFEQVLAETKAEHDQLLATLHADRGLPLIVLAGLR